MDDFFEVEPVVRETKRCYQLLSALCEYLDVEAHKKEQSTPQEYVFVKKGSPEAKQYAKASQQEAKAHAERVRWRAHQLFGSE